MIIDKEREVMSMVKAIIFDMDGTIADFYGVDTWSSDIANHNVRPYVQAEPLWDMTELSKILVLLQKIGIKIIITSWLAKNGTSEYNDEIRKAKKDWLKKYDFPYDEIHLVKYGTTKAKCTRKYGVGQILIDDNDKVRKGWTLGETINPTTENIVEILADLLLIE